MKNRQLYIDCNDESDKLLASLKENIEMVAGMGIEMFETNKVIVLSPIMRRLFLDRIKQLDNLYTKLHYSIQLDWPQGNKDVPTSIS